MNGIELKLEPSDNLKVDNLVQEGEKVTDEKIEESLNYDLLSDNEKKAIDDFVEKIDVFDSTQILQFGASSQAKISEFSDSVLEDVRTKNTGAVGDLLANLVAEIKSFDGDVGKEPKGLGKLFTNAKKEIDKILAKYTKIEKNIDVIEKDLEKDKILMLKDIALFDTMYEKNLTYFKEISLYFCTLNCYSKERTFYNGG